jgi:hypothetical protein
MVYVEVISQRKHSSQFKTAPSVLRWLPLRLARMLSSGVRNDCQRRDQFKARMYGDDRRAFSPVLAAETSASMLSGLRGMWLIHS